MCPLKALGLPCSSYIYLLSDVIFSFVLFVILGMCVFGVFGVCVCCLCVCGCLRGNGARVQAILR